MRSKMPYTVFGFRSGFLSTAKLHIDSLKRKAALMPLHLNQRMMHGYAVKSEGFNFLERRFGSGFENFVLLNDVAIRYLTSTSRLPHPGCAPFSLLNLRPQPRIQIVLPVCLLQ